MPRRANVGVATILYTAGTLEPGRYWIEAHNDKSVTQLDLWIRALPAGAITMVDFVSGQHYEFALFDVNQPVERWSLYGDGSGLGYPAAAADAKSHKDVPTTGMPTSVDIQNPLDALKAALSEAGPLLLVVVVAYVLLNKRS